MWGGDGPPPHPEQTAKDPARAVCGCSPTLPQSWLPFKAETRELWGRGPPGHRLACQALKCQHRVGFAVVCSEAPSPPPPSLRTHEGGEWEEGLATPQHETHVAVAYNVHMCPGKCPPPCGHGWPGLQAVALVAVGLWMPRKLASSRRGRRLQAVHMLRLASL